MKLVAVRLDLILVHRELAGPYLLFLRHLGFAAENNWNLRVAIELALLWVALHDSLCLLKTKLSGSLQLESILLLVKPLLKLDFELLDFWSIVDEVGFELLVLTVVDGAEVKEVVLNSVFVNEETGELDGSGVNIDGFLETLALGGDLDEAAKDACVSRLVKDFNSELLTGEESERIGLDSEVRQFVNLQLNFPLSFSLVLEMYIILLLLPDSHKAQIDEWLEDNPRFTRNNTQPAVGRQRAGCRSNNCRQRRS